MKRKMRRRRRRRRRKKAVLFAPYPRHLPYFPNHHLLVVLLNKW